MAPRRSSYTVREKARAVLIAEEHGNRAAGREVGVSEKLIRDWRKAKAAGAWQTIVKGKRKLGCGRRAFHPALEAELTEWLRLRRSTGITVSTDDIRRKAKVLGQMARFAVEDSVKFSPNWCYLFMKRNHLAMRERTTLAQKLPEDLTAKVLEFQRFVINCRQEREIDLAQIGNMDEVPVCFDMPTKRTVHEKGAKSILVRTTGHEKSHFTVVLACMADGTKLPPTIILKRKTMPRIAVPVGVVLRVHAKGWMNLDGMVDWLRGVWERRPGAFHSPNSLLVMDSFKPHKDNAIKDRLRGKGTALSIIPGGLTSMCQPLDVSLNKPFKLGIKKRWSQWMETGEHTFTVTGRQRAPTIDVLCQWVKESWDEVKLEIVIKSFRKCGISNALDGTEDDDIFADEVDANVNVGGADDDDDDHMAMRELERGAGDDNASEDEDMGEGDTDDEFGYETDDAR